MYFILYFVTVTGNLQFWLCHQPLSIIILEDKLIGLPLCSHLILLITCMITVRFVIDFSTQYDLCITMFICMNKQEIAYDSKNTGIVPNKRGPVLLSQVKLLRRPAIWSDTSFKETGLVMLLCSAFLSWESCKFKHWSACSVIYEDLSGNVL